MAPRHPVSLILVPVALAGLTACGSRGSASPAPATAESTLQTAPCLDAASTFSYDAAGALTNSACTTKSGDLLAFLWGGKCPDGSIQVWQTKSQTVENSGYWHLRVQPGQTATVDSLPGSDAGYLGSNCTTKIAPK